MTQFLSMYSTCTSSGLSRSAVAEEVLPPDILALRLTDHPALQGNACQAAGIRSGPEMRGNRGGDAAFGALH
ncbi:MAG: hypothetical protein ACREUM_02615, partial [Nitrosospira sp.]